MTVVVLVAVLVIAVYGLTALFTQTVPSTAVKAPGGTPTATGNCSTLTSSVTSITLSAVGDTYGNMDLTCSGGAAFTVTSEGPFTAIISGPNGCTDVSCMGGYYGGYAGFLKAFNYTSWQTQGCGAPGNDQVNGYVVPTYGSFVVLSGGAYVYCLGYALKAYNTGSPTSLPSFTVTWNAP